MVNIVTRGGTNEFHGSANWFCNGSKLNARSNLDKRNFPRAPWRVGNQFAGTLGGPVVKDLTFFFGPLLRWTDRRFASGTAIGAAPTAEGQAILRNAAASRAAFGLALNLPQAQILNNYQIADNFSILKGAHTIKMGLDFRRQDQIQDLNPTIRGRLAYNTLQDFVDDVAQTASINTFLPGVPRWQAYRYYDYFFYVQDEWRVNRRLTLTCGLR